MRIESGRHRVAIVVTRLAGGGGVPAVAEFLYQAIDRSTVDKLPTAGSPDTPPRWSKRFASTSRG